MDDARHQGDEGSDDRTAPTDEADRLQPPDQVFAVGSEHPVAGWRRRLGLE
jgi:hypothetical protein